MKKLIAGVVAGLVLGVTGTGIAATQGGYWSEGGTGYKCEGIAAGVTCKSGGYEFGATKSFVYIAKTGQKKLLFGCRKYDGWDSCVNSTTS
jgi:hypothetical protein